jgi:hypothetical protein
VALAKTRDWHIAFGVMIENPMEYAEHKMNSKQAEQD